MLGQIFQGVAAAYENGTAYVNTGKGSTWEGGIRMPAYTHACVRVLARDDFCRLSLSLSLSLD